MRKKGRRRRKRRKKGELGEKTGTSDSFALTLLMLAKEKRELEYIKIYELIYICIH